VGKTIVLGSAKSCLGTRKRHKKSALIILEGEVGSKRFAKVFAMDGGAGVLSVHHLQP